jgi:hypothetical protein
MQLPLAAITKQSVSYPSGARNPQALQRRWGGTAEENVEESAAPVPDGALSAANATDQVVR